MLNPEEIVAHPHLAHRNAFPAVNHPVAGSARVTATPFQLDGNAVVPRGPVPYRIGQNGHDVLTGWLGYSEVQVQALVAQGAVVLETCEARA